MISILCITSEISRLLLNLDFSLSVNKTNHYNSRCIIPINIKFWTVKTAYTRTVKDVSYGWKRKITKAAQKWPKTAKSTYKNSTLKKRGKGVRRGGATHWLLIIMPKQISDWHKWIKHEWWILTFRQFLSELFQKKLFRIIASTSFLVRGLITSWTIIRNTKNILVRNHPESSRFAPWESD